MTAAGTAHDIDGLLNCRQVTLPLGLSSLLAVAAPPLLQSHPESRQEGAVS